jgi:hypothetical protein
VKKNSIERFPFFLAGSALLFVLILLRVLSSHSIPGDGAQRNIAYENELRRQLEALADQTTGKSDICPIHKAKMNIKSLDIAYGLIRPIDPQPSPEVRLSQFPFAQEEVLGGCVVSDLFPKKARIYQCPLCLSNQAAWFAANPK